jgi:hypothetical protein
MDSVSPVARIWACLLVLAALLGALGCGDKDDSGSTADKADKPAAKQPSKSSAFDASTVRVRRLSKEALGGQVEAYFIAKGPPRMHLAQAKACVEDGLDGAKSAFCYAFPSEAAFRAAKVNRSRGGMKKLCWSAYWGKPLEGEPSGADGSPTAQLEKCPNAYVGE